MTRLDSLFSTPRPLIGVIHLLALPGTPAHGRPLADIIELACDEASIYHDCGVDGFLLENMHDTPYLKAAVGPEIVAAMTAAAVSIREKVPNVPVGVQVLAAANREALAVAHAAGLDFVRVEGFAFAHVADEGLIEASAGDLLRYRRALGADRIGIWADVKKKHSAHAITADVSLGETVHTAAFFRADAVVVTGSLTGQAPTPKDLIEAASASNLPVLLGSGITPDNVDRFLPAADGFIVGSYMKEGGNWANPVDPARVKQMVHKLASLR